MVKKTLNFGEVGVYEVGTKRSWNEPLKNHAPIGVFHACYDTKRVDRHYKPGEQTYSKLYSLTKDGFNQYFLIPSGDAPSESWATSRIEQIFKRNKNGVVNNPQTVKVRNRDYKWIEINVPVLTLKEV